MSAKGTVGTERSLAVKIAQANDWDRKVMILCEHHRLPDLRTRHGLKQIHTSFDQVIKQLYSTYDDHADHEDVRTALGVLWGVMCTDFVLEDKMVDKGLFLRMKSFMAREDVRTLAMAILLRMVNHHGPPRWEIMRTLYPVLAKVFRAAMDAGDVSTVKSLLHVFSEGAQVVLVYNDTKEQSDHIDPHLDEILRFHTAALAALQLPGAPHHTIYVDFLKLMNIVIGFKTSVPILWGQPSVIHLLGIGLSGSNVMFDRLQSLNIFLRLHRHGKEPQPGFDIPHAWDILQNGLSDEDKAPILAYGVERSEACLAAEARDEFIQAILAHRDDPDILTCGWTIHQTILKHGLGVFSSAPEPWMGIPFKDLLDILPLCATALRNAGPSTRKNIDAADMLDLRCHHERKNKATAYAIARRAMERSPGQGYFACMAAFTCAEIEDVYPLAKLGLEKADDSTPWYIRLALHQVAVEGAFDLAMIAISGCMNGLGKYEVDDAASFLLDAVDNIRAYVDLAPPDSRELKEMIAFELIIRFALRGREIVTYMATIDNLVEQYQVADRLSNLLHKNPDLPYMERMLKTFLTKYEAAYSEWEPVLVTCQFTPGEFNRQPSGAPGSIAHLLTSLPEDTSHEIWDRMAHPKDVRMPKVPPQILFRCAKCHNPSAALRRCSRCRLVAYCSINCQKSDWKGENGDGHKQKCIVMS